MNIDPLILATDPAMKSNIHKPIFLAPVSMLLPALITSIKTKIQVSMPMLNVTKIQQIIGSPIGNI